MMRGGYLDELERLLADNRCRRLVVVTTGSRLIDPDEWTPAIRACFELIAGFCDCPDGRRGQYACGCIRLIHGQAKGADDIADWDATSRGWPVRKWPVRRDAWLVNGGYAGHLRNRDMVDEAARVAERLHAQVLCTAFIHNESRGASGCAAYAQLSGIPTLRVTTEDLWIPRVRAA